VDHIGPAYQSTPAKLQHFRVANQHQRRSDELAVLVERIENYTGTELSNREIGFIVQAFRGLKMDEFEMGWQRFKAELGNEKNRLSVLKTVSRKSSGDVQTCIGFRQSASRHWS
jgi:hypothetical protein